MRIIIYFKRISSKIANDISRVVLAALLGLISSLFILQELQVDQVKALLDAHCDLTGEIQVDAIGDLGFENLAEAVADGIG